MPNYHRFKSYLVIEKGIGDLCANEYLDSVRRFYEATGLFEPAKDDIINYMMTYHEKGFSYSYTVNTMLSLEHYMAFIGQELKMQRPRKPNTKVEDWLTEQEMARLFVYCKNVREQTILVLLAYTGIRNLELCSLLTRNINFESQTVFIKAGKGLKDGVVCIAPVALGVIMEYLKEYPRRPEETLLFSIEGNRYSEKMRPGAIRKHVKIIAERAGINRRIFPHLFRHSLAMNMLSRGCDIYSVKEQLRHVFISTTERYIASNPQIMRNNYQVFVPQYQWGAPQFNATPKHVFMGSNSLTFNR